MNVFISHAATDRAFAQRLASALKEHDIDVWSAAEIRPGDNFAKAITDAVSRADVIIPILSRASAGSPAVTAEIAMAVASRLEGGRKRIVPVLADRSVEAPFFLRDLQWVDLSDDEKFSHNLAKLLSGLPSDQSLGSDETQSLKRRGEWLRLQRVVLEAESEAMEIGLRRQFRYITRTLVAASVVGLLGVLGFAALRKFGGAKDSISVAFSILSFIGGALMGPMLHYFWQGRRGDE